MTGMTSTPTVPQSNKRPGPPTATTAGPEPFGFSETWAGRAMKAWRTLGYDGQSLVLIPLALAVYWWRNPEGGPTIKWLGVWFLFVVARVYARLRSHSDNE